MAKAKRNQDPVWLATGLGYGGAVALAAAVNGRFGPALAVDVREISSPNWFGLVLRFGKAQYVREAGIFAEAWLAGLKQASAVEKADHAYWADWRAARCDTCVYHDKPCAGCVDRVKQEVKAKEVAA